MSFPSFSAGEVLTAADMNALGLWLVSTTTVGTGVATVSVNNCFSANYNSYRVVWQSITASTGSNFNLQLNGITGNVYSAGGSFTTYGSATLNGFGPAASSAWIVGPANTFTAGSIDIYNPFNTLNKGFTGGGTSNSSQYAFNGYANSTTSATGFSMIPSVGTITGGTIRVYGYRN
jgi:hypothetical protein